MNAPLHRIKVLDFTRVAAGPYCAMMLGDMGAEVIKIEEPFKGDDLRHMDKDYLGGESTYFLGLNRNKKSIALDLKSPQGNEIAKKLAKWADVIMESFRPGVMQKIGLHYEEIIKINPNVIYCSISAFGQEGPLSLKPAMDIIIQAVGGIMGITGEQDRPPVKVGAPITDFATTFIACYGIMLALYVREKTGLGQKVETSLLDSTISLLANHATGFLTKGIDMKPMGSAHPQMVPYQAFETKDKYIIVGVMNQKFWYKFCKALDMPDLASDPRFCDNPSRVKNKAELIPILEKNFRERPGDEWLKLLEQEDIPCAPINTLSQLFKEEQVKINEMIIDIDHPTAGKIKTLGIPVKLSKTPGRVQSPPPRLGQHTDQILINLGYTQDEIDRMRNEKIIQ